MNARSSVLPGLFDQGDRPRATKAGSVRQTSVIAKQALEAEGQLRGRKGWVLAWLRRCTFRRNCSAPTSAELAQWVRGCEHFSPWADRAEPKPSLDALLLYVRRGVSDLQTIGAIESVPNGMRECTVTKRTCETWRVRTR